MKYSHANVTDFCSTYFLFKAVVESKINKFEIAMNLSKNLKQYSLFLMKQRSNLLVTLNFELCYFELGRYHLLLDRCLHFSYIVLASCIVGGWTCILIV